MSYSTNFFFSYYKVLTAGTIPAQFRISFKRRDYTGEAIEILPGGEPLVIEAVDSPDNPLSSMWPLKFTFELVCQEYWQAESFYTEDERELLVLIEIDEGSGFAVEHFGWITAVDFKMDHSSKPFKVSVVASDGLASLKTRSLLDANGKRLQGYVSLSTILRSAFSNAGFDQPLTTGVNLFEQTEVGLDRIDNKANPATDPLYQALVNSETLVTDSGDTQFGWDALKRVVDLFGCRLSQTKGQWWVIRADEAAGGWDLWNNTSTETIHTRTYTSNLVSDAPGSHTSRNLILDVGKGLPAQILAGGPVDLLPIPKKAIKLEQSYGRYQSRLPNADFSQVDSTFLPVGWRRNNISEADGFRAGSGTELDPYRLVLYGAGDEKLTADSPYIGIRVDYDQNSPEFSQSITRTITGEFQLHNAKSAKIVVFAFTPEGGYIGQASGAWKMNPSKKEQVGILIDHSQMVANVMQTKPGWAEISIKMDPIDRVFSFLFYLCQAEALTKPNGLPEQGPPRPYIEYRNIRMEVAKAGQNITGTSQVVALPNQKPTDTTLSLTLGDVAYSTTPYDRLNTLFRRSANPPAPQTNYYYADADVLVSNPTGHNVGKSALSWLIQKYARQMMQLAPTFEGQIIGRFPAGIHTVLRLLDFGEMIDGVFVPYLLQLTRWKWRTKMDIHEVTAVRINSTDTVGLPIPKAYWQTPDGEVPMNVDDSGNPVNPALSQGSLSERDQFLKNLSLSGIKPNVTLQPNVAGFSNLTGKSVVTLSGYIGDEFKGKVLAQLLKNPNLSHFV
ncbi:hypothetical protein GO755_30380 [Spirosoma sp. HMF4905]|uniref:Uncharacterized protein n=1 Tax=Spirosoma arboris TaxID=2682092 RepID=A0A7K1SKU6_9BACT|nr:hypothetical protein [Spirosoma arboris]MVM34378.1 hypothetical protein [Spirosoma arboris]